MLCATAAGVGSIVKHPLFQRSKITDLPLCSECSLESFLCPTSHTLANRADPAVSICKTLTSHLSPPSSAQSSHPSSPLCSSSLSGAHHAPRSHRPAAARGSFHWKPDHSIPVQSLVLVPHFTWPCLPWSLPNSLPCPLCFFFSLWTMPGLCSPLKHAALGGLLLGVCLLSLPDVCKAGSVFSRILSSPPPSGLL